MNIDNKIIQAINEDIDSEDDMSLTEMFAPEEPKFKCELPKVVLNKNDYEIVRHSIQLRLLGKAELPTKIAIDIDQYNTFSVEYVLKEDVLDPSNPVNGVAGLIASARVANLMKLSDFHRICNIKIENLSKNELNSYIADRGYFVFRFEENNCQDHSKMIGSVAISYFPKGENFYISNPYDSMKRGIRVMAPGVFKKLCKQVPQFEENQKVFEIDVINNYKGVQKKKIIPLLALMCLNGDVKVADIHRFII